MPRTVRESSANFTLSGEWSPWFFSTGAFMYCYVFIISAAACSQRSLYYRWQMSLWMSSNFFVQFFMILTKVGTRVLCANMHKLFTILILDFWEFKKQLNQQLCYLGQRALSTLCLKKTVHFCFVRTSSNFHELLIVLVDRWKSGWNYMVYKYFFPPNLTHVTSLPCESRSNLLHNVEMYHLQQTMWRRN